MFETVTFSTVLHSSPSISPEMQDAYRGCGGARELESISATLFVSTTASSNHNKILLCDNENGIEDAASVRNLVF